MDHLRNMAILYVLFVFIDIAVLHAVAQLPVESGGNAPSIDVMPSEDSSNVTEGNESIIGVIQPTNDTTINSTGDSGHSMDVMLPRDDSTNATGGNAQSMNVTVMPQDDATNSTATDDQTINVIMPGEDETIFTGGNENITDAIIPQDNATSSTGRTELGIGGNASNIESIIHKEVAGISDSNMSLPNVVTDGMENSATVVSNVTNEFAESVKNVSTIDSANIPENTPMIKINTIETFQLGESQSIDVGLVPEQNSSQIVTGATNINESTLTNNDTAISAVDVSDYSNVTIPSGSTDSPVGTDTNSTMTASASITTTSTLLTNSVVETTTPTPCRRRRCRNLCAAGREVDSNGCETCKCKRPKNCPPSLRASRLLCLIQLRTRLSCDTDSDCSRRRICCPGSCGKICRRPISRRSKFLIVAQSD